MNEHRPDVDTVGNERSTGSWPRGGYGREELRRAARAVGRVGAASRTMRGILTQLGVADTRRHYKLLAEALRRNQVPVTLKEKHQLRPARRGQCLGYSIEQWRAATAHAAMEGLASIKAILGQLALRYSPSNYCLALAFMRRHGIAFYTATDGRRRYVRGQCLGRDEAAVREAWSAAGRENATARQILAAMGVAPQTHSAVTTLARYLRTRKPPMRFAPCQSSSFCEEVDLVPNEHGQRGHP
jgi:hypothetical protein